MGAGGAVAPDLRCRGALVTMSIRFIVLPLVGLLATAADAPPLTALAQLQPGKWTLTSRDGEFATRSICLGDPKVLIQVRQPLPTCNRFVVANDPRRAVVSYTCAGAGNGLTTIRVETPRLAQIETQGVAAGSPFDLAIEARRTGECPALSMR
jgi:hypothetical protein